MAYLVIKRCFTKTQTFSRKYGTPNLPDNKTMYARDARGQALLFGIHIFVNICKFGDPYFHEFASDSRETSHIYEIRHDKSRGEVCFLLE